MSKSICTTRIHPNENQEPFVHWWRRPVRKCGANTNQFKRVSSLSLLIARLGSKDTSSPAYPNCCISISRVKFGRVLASLDRVRRLHCDSTLASKGFSYVTLHPDVSMLTPASSPWVPHNPVIHTILCAVPNHSNTVVQCIATFTREYALREISRERTWVKYPISQVRFEGKHID